MPLDSSHKSNTSKVSQPHRESVDKTVSFLSVGFPEPSHKVLMWKLGRILFSSPSLKTNSLKQTQGTNASTSAVYSGLSKLTAT